MRTFFSRENFWLKCNLWKRDRDFDSTNATGILADVFDGKVWQEFL